MPGSAAVENNFFGDMVDDFDDAFDAAFNPGLQRTEQNAEVGQVEHDQAPYRICLQI
jgi:hypothetical protein